MFWSDGLIVRTLIWQRICVDTWQSYYCVSQRDSLHMLNLPTHISDPVLQSLTYSIYVLSPLRVIFFLWEIRPFMHTWEENVSVSCLELYVLPFLYCLCADPMLSWWWWHFLSALPSFYDKVRTSLRIHPGRTLYPSFEHAAGFNLEDAWGE